MNMEKKQTPIVPIFDPVRVAYFCETPELQRKVKLSDQIEVVTAPLKPGVAIDLLGLSLLSDAIREGLMDFTDVVDPDLGLKALYYQCDDGNFSNVMFDPPIPFSPSVNDNCRTYEVVAEIANMSHVESGEPVRGRMNSETGTLMFDENECVQAGGRRYRLVGFELDARRANSSKEKFIFRMPPPMSQPKEEIVQVTLLPIDRVVTFDLIRGD